METNTKLRHLKIISLLENKEGEIDDTVAPERDRMMSFSHEGKEKKEVDHRCSGSRR